MLRGDAMNDVALTILHETQADGPAIERLHERTFGPDRYAKTAYSDARSAQALDCALEQHTGEQ